MDYTERYRLAKPSYDDDVDIQVLNSNFDIIDGALNVSDYLPLSGGTVTGTTKFKDIASLDGADEFNITCNGGEVSITKNGTYFNDARMIGIVSRDVTSGEGLTPNTGSSNVNYNYQCITTKYDNGDLIIEYYLVRSNADIAGASWGNYSTYVTLNFPVPFTDDKYAITFASNYVAPDTSYWLGGNDFGTWRVTSTSATMYIPPFKDARYTFKGSWK